MFDFRIPVTSAGIDFIKADLTKALPDVKSSHRVEAAARGFGFSTYAGMRAAARASNGISAAVDWQAFTTYLKAQGFKVSSLNLYRAVARVAICAILEHMPQLTMAGIGIGRYRRNPDGSWETARQYYARMLESREEFLRDRAAEEFLRSLAFLSLVKPIKTINPSSGSYWLKHIAEEYRCIYPDGQPLGPAYVSNGAFIAAAAHAGFAIRQYPDSLNTSFNISKRCLVDLDCEIRPNGAHAQDRARRKETRCFRLGYAF